MDDSITLADLFDLIIKQVKPSSQIEANSSRLSAITGSRPTEVRMLDIEGVEAYTSLSSTSIYELIAQGDFPRGKRLTSRRVGWDIYAIDRWLESRPEQQPNTNEYAPGQLS